jgi:pimeloyl-ACP methyl ester carboxylesterase
VTTVPERDVVEHPPTGRFGGVAQPETRAVRLHGHRLVYRIGGGAAGPDRPAVVLVHGIAGSSDSWRTVLPELAHHYTVLAPDLLGHGESDKPRHDYSLGAYANQVRDLMIAIGIDRATIVGHSLGGGIAMQLAYQHPLRCERLVLVSSGGLGNEISWIFRALTVPGSEYVMPLLFPGFVRAPGNLIAGAIRKLGIRAPHLEEAWRSYATLTDPRRRHAFVRTLRSVIDARGQTVSAHDRLYLSSAMPTLIIWGRRDRIIPVEHATAANELMANSQLEIFEESGHSLHIEEPERFVEAIRAFVDTTEPMHVDEAAWRAILTAGRQA